MNKKLCCWSQKQEIFFLYNIETETLENVSKEWLSIHLKHLIRTSIKKNSKPIKSILKGNMDFYDKLMKNENLGSYWFVIHNGWLKLEFMDILKTNRKPQECCVCYEDNYFLLNCNHSLCIKCWAHMHMHNQHNCPYCRQEMSYNYSYHSHYIPLKSIQM